MNLPKSDGRDCKVALGSTLGEVYDRLREEWDALGHLSYHGGADGGAWYADLTKEDVEGIRRLLRDACATIEGYS